MRLAAVLALLFSISPPVRGEAKWWSFEDRNYYNPLTAGVREAQVSAMAVGYGSRVEFQVRDDDPRLIWDIDLGAELPIVGWESEKSADETARVPAGATGVGLWLPIDFHLLTDHADNSGPVVNTDYRFGATLKLERGLTEASWLAMRVNVGHESTHLGDEFSIVGRRRHPRQFERINVSWEFLDVGVMYESFGGALPWSVRVGATRLIRGDSYYETSRESITESPRGPVTPSTNKTDCYAGFDSELENVWFNRTWGPYLSTEVRWRSVYDYHKADPDAPEDRQASVNVVAGLKKSGTPAGIGRAAPFIRYYRGVNPHGQFRNQRDYVEYGVGVRLVR